MNEGCRHLNAQLIPIFPYMDKCISCGFSESVKNRFSSESILLHAHFSIYLCCYSIFPRPVSRKYIRSKSAMRANDRGCKRGKRERKERESRLEWLSPCFLLIRDTIIWPTKWAQLIQGLGPAPDPLNSCEPRINRPEIPASWGHPTTATSFYASRPRTELKLSMHPRPC